MPGACFAGQPTIWVKLASIRSGSRPHRRSGSGATGARGVVEIVQLSSGPPFAESRQRAASANAVELADNSRASKRPDRLAVSLSQSRPGGTADATA